MPTALAKRPDESWTLSRMWMQEMTEKAFRDAYRGRRPLSERDGLGEAGYTRDQADWLSGMMIGREVRNFDGSFYAWAARSDLPLVVGDAP